MKIRKVDSKGRLTLGPESAGKWFQVEETSPGWIRAIQVTHPEGGGRDVPTVPDDEPYPAVAVPTYRKVAEAEDFTCEDCISEAMMDVGNYSGSLDGPIPEEEVDDFLKALNRWAGECPWGGVRE